MLITWFDCLFCWLQRKFLERSLIMNPKEIINQEEIFGEVVNLCCKLLSNYSVITVYSVVYCHSDSNVGYWSINITAFWKVIRLEHVNLDSVTSQSSQVTCYLEKVTYETTQPCGTQLGCRHTVCLWIGADPATANPFRANSQSIISPSTAKFLHTIAATWLCLLKPSGDTKRMVRKQCMFEMLKFFWSVFQLTFVFWANPRSIISSHRPNLALPLPPPACVY